MAMTPERYAEIDAELQRMHEYLSTLFVEIEETVTTDTLDYAALAVNQAAAQVGYARRWLTLAQRKIRRT